MADLNATFDVDGYPTDEFLDRLPRFTGTPGELVEGLVPVFEPYGSVDVERVPVVAHGPIGCYRVGMVTGGWSGNEAVVAALKDTSFWHLWWQSSTRGGLHRFEVPAGEWDTPMGEWPQPKSAVDRLMEVIDEHRQPVPGDVSNGMRRYFPPEGLLARLRQRYTADSIPPCRVCGGELSLASMGGGHATVYACPPPQGVSIIEHTDHYNRSKFVHLREGDPDVLALVDAVEDLVEREGPA